MRFTTKVTACALLLASTTGLSLAHKSHPYRPAPPVDYKCETPVCPCPPQLMDGFYVGASIGYDVVTSDANFYERNRLSISGNPKIAATGWDGGLFLGYGRYFDCFYLGGEIFGNYSGASESITITGPNGYVHASVDANGDYGLAILPGLRLNNATTGYIKLGYDWANFNGNARVHVNNPPQNFSGSGNNTRNGWLYGVGLETLLQCNWSLRAEYIYTNLTNSNNGGHGTRVNPNNHRFSVGLLYHFG